MTRRIREPLPPFSSYPLTPERWHDFEQLFGEQGACGGCWCMYWYVSHSVFERQKGTVNREAMQARVAAGKIPGILGYVDDQPVGWCAVAPRAAFPRLQNSRILSPIDNAPVWSVVCLFIAKPWRRHGLSVQLLQAATEYVRAQGGTITEGYPVEPQAPNRPPAFLWTGTASAFRQAGYIECARRSKTRPIMRYEKENK